ncbi:hypothetical protein GGS21DRAFT_467754 [Xylaria nigripes]|nr:hypothetical protein GGS21DRAFT_467754 [Xylaria nigripes]
MCRHINTQMRCQSGVRKKRTYPLNFDPTYIITGFFLYCFQILRCLHPHKTLDFNPTSTMPECHPCLDQTLTIGIAIDTIYLTAFELAFTPSALFSSILFSTIS